MKPSLEQYKGCNIIDVNPGAGLWSRKIHEYLNPRSHVFYEPLRHRYRHFLEPLVDAPGSKYTFAPLELSPEEDGSLAPLGELYRPLTWDMIPEKPNTTDADGLVNRSTLVLANFSRDLKTTRSNSMKLRVSPAEPMVYMFIRLLQTMAGIHTYGAVRLLIWICDRDKFNFLPRNISLRKALVTAIEEFYSVHEVVGACPPPQSRRPSKMDVSSALNIARKMLETGIELPEDRRSALHTEAFGCVKASQGSVDVKSSHSDVTDESTRNLAIELDDLLRLERLYAEGKFQKTMPPEKGADKRKKIETPEFRRRNELRDKFDMLVGKSDSPGMRSDDVDRCVFALADLNEFERDLKAKRNSDAQDQPLVLDESEEQQLKGLEDRWEKTKHLRDTRDKANKFVNNIDNLEAFKSEPPLLLWDRRQYEPLESEENEFFPMNKLALLDFQPLPHAAEDTGPVQAHILVRAMRPLPNMPVTEALDIIAHGCSNDILSKCPTIRNPLLGGRLRTENLRVRMLTQRMWKELVAAWDQWPFRLNDEKLLFQMGRSTAFYDFDNEE